MTTQTDRTADPMVALAEITGSGGAGEMHVEQVLGAPVQVYSQRFRALHEVLAASLEHGERPYLVTLEGSWVSGSI